MSPIEQRRFDHEVIAGWIAPGARVLDLGCGDGSLLALLQQQKQVRGYGIDIDPANVLACVGKGVNVIQSDIDRGLAGFEDRFFDQVVMSLSLQTVHHTEQVLQEMLRVGREAIISFPNFAYWPNRQAILNGRMPVSKDLPYQWYDTPNVRFFTIADFDALCADHGFIVHERRAFDQGQPVDSDINYLASLAFYRLGR